MKNFILIFIYIVFFSLFSVSCNDYLDEREGQYSTEGLDYTDSERMVLPMLGNYQIIFTRGWEDFPLLSVRGDDVNAGGLNDQVLYSETDLYNYNKDYWMYNSLWQNMYKDMVDINANIIQLENYKAKATGSYIALADQYIAESKVLRAWLQFQLTRTWGNIYIMKTNTPASDIAEGIKTKDEIMQYISDLMDEAIPDLPAVRPNERTDIPGGVTKYTALSLKALANLELKEYQKVADATGEIIKSNLFSLYPDYYELFKKPGKLSDESIFEFQYSDITSTSTNYCCWGFFGPQGWSPAVNGASDGWGFYEPSLKYIKFMIQRGEVTRLKTNVLFTNRGIQELTDYMNGTPVPTWISNTTPDGDVINDYSRAMFASGKHYLPSIQLTPGRKDYGSGMNMPVIRYAEVLLMYAEALKQGATGNAITADQAVNLVRTRAGLTNKTGVTLEDVLDEKYAELAMEWGIRFYDMVRLNKYDELSYDGRTFSADKQFLPYPQAQVDALGL